MKLNKMLATIAMTVMLAGCQMPAADEQQTLLGAPTKETIASGDKEIKPVNLHVALHQRAVEIAQIIARRMTATGQWDQWDRNHPLCGELEDYDKVRYWRCDRPKEMTWVVFDNIHPSDFKVKDWGEPVTLGSPDVNRTYSDEVQIRDGDSLSHTWTTTTTHTESILNSYLAGVKLAARTLIGNIYTGQFQQQIEAEATFSYTHNISDTDTTTTTNTTTVTEHGPARGNFVFQRSTQNVQRIVLSGIDLDHTIEFGGIWHGLSGDFAYPLYKAQSMQEMISAAEGLLPVTHNMDILFNPDRIGQHGNGRARKADDDEIRRLKLPSDTPVQTVTEYTESKDSFFFEPSSSDGQQKLGAIDDDITDGAIEILDGLFGDKQQETDK